MAIAGIGTISEIWHENRSSNIGFNIPGSHIRKFVAAGLSSFLIESGSKYTITFPNGFSKELTTALVASLLGTTVKASGGATIVTTAGATQNAIELGTASGVTYYAGASATGVLFLGASAEIDASGTGLSVTEDGHEWTRLAEVNSITGPSFSKTQIDVTSMDTTGGYREFISGLKDAGEITLAMNFTRESYDRAIEIFNEVGDEGVEDFSLTLNDNPTLANRSCFWFKASVVGAPVSIPIEDKITMTVTLRVSGLVMFGTNGGDTAPTTSVRGNTARPKYAAP